MRLRSRDSNPDFRDQNPRTLKRAGWFVRDSGLQNFPFIGVGPVVGGGILG